MLQSTLYPDFGHVATNHSQLTVEPIHFQRAHQLISEWKSFARPVFAKKRQATGRAVASRDGFRNISEGNRLYIRAKGKKVYFFRWSSVILNDLIANPICSKGDQVTSFQRSAVPFIKKRIFRLKAFKSLLQKAEPS